MINSLTDLRLSRGKLAHLFHEDFGKPDGEFETVHFKDFTAAIFYRNDPGAPDIRLFVEPAETLAEANRRVAEIHAIFRFLGEWNDLLTCDRYDLPQPGMLLRTA